jgi:phenylalanyl-tRNA synthetase beta chain
MRVPLSWLREYCDPPIDVGGIEERLTMTGTKVEAVHHHGVGDPGGFVVGQVLECRQHPDADRLRVCLVDLGPVRPEGPATIVCGAPNVAAGQSVAVACPGALMPDRTSLQEARLRGILSEGMILAEDELELGTAHAGIIVLDELLPPGSRPAPGTPLAQVLQIADDVLELEITPNRPDCLAVYGIARELHAATGSPLAPAPWETVPAITGLLGEQPRTAEAELVASLGGTRGQRDESRGRGEVGSGQGRPDGDQIQLEGRIELPPSEHVRVSLDCPELCPRFTVQVFSDVSIGPSPLWLKARLMAAGQRPINNVVDITNYVMLLTGQPLHAFDLDRVAGRHLLVRRATEGEQLVTLDGQTRTLDGRMIVIADGHGGTSIAGLMGGERSEVHDGTTRILLEGACWDGPTIHRASWLLGLRSEASTRFEKGLAPEQCHYAQALACDLMLDCAGARTAGRAIDLGWRPTPAPVIRLRSTRLGAILGVPVSAERQHEILGALDFGLEPGADSANDEAVLDVSVPPLRRNDVTREIDLIEEIARIDGLERLPATLPARRGAAGRLSHAQRARRAAEDVLAGHGLHEIVGWSFTDPRLPDWLQLGEGDPMRRLVRLENPLSEAQSVLRPTLLVSLLDGARHNLSRGASEIAIFESGSVYRAAADPDQDGAVGDEPLGHEPVAHEPPADEHHALGALLTGTLAPRSWRSREPGEADFFAVKALLEAVLETLRVDFSLEPAPRPFLHPARSATIRGSAAEFGFIGELHPLLAARWDLQRSAVFELDLDLVVRASPPTTRFLPFPSTPPIRRDLAVTLPEALPADQALATIRNAAGELLERARVFDVYTGEQVGPGRRSLAIALTFQAPDRTLTEEEIAPLWERIGTALAEIGGEVRA